MWNTGLEQLSDFDSSCSLQGFSIAHAGPLFILGEWGPFRWVQPSMGSWGNISKGGTSLSSKGLARLYVSGFYD